MQEVDHIFIKTTAPMSPAFPMIREMYPNAKYIFNTRHYKNTLSSYMQLVQFMPKLGIKMWAVFNVRTERSGM